MLEKTASGFVANVLNSLSVLESLPKGIKNSEALPERNRDSKDPEGFDFKPMEYCFIRHSFRNQTRQKKPIPEYKSFRDLEK